MLCCLRFVFFCKQKTAYDMRISDWSSDVVSSDLKPASALPKEKAIQANKGRNSARIAPSITSTPSGMLTRSSSPNETQVSARTVEKRSSRRSVMLSGAVGGRSEEHTSELQSLMRISYAVFRLEKKKISKKINKKNEKTITSIKGK